ncbi:MAG: DUF2062 domain-containing protein [Sagittula sp.]|uniref:DUF2062 domain-containing protein n=1 Tax=unclassified Sagittula TaxID=2624628 RepID=UPI000C2D26F4|nr:MULTISPECIES: DUF2062 domain-containing protein [unclassified Sagittula]AUC52851.1 DNA-directed RNA polymerase subunit omega [Sagittula sp. P11]WHZ35890.1 DUF2062 domain-containing protein [Sagittula sp. MA-2]
MFKRRDRRPIWRIVAEALWPKGGWGRAARYVRLRLNRLPDPPNRIARGIFAGVFTTFTPFYGLHFIVAATLAWLMRGNILAALLSTFFGNPLTYVPIGVIAMKTGYWLLGLHGHPDHHDGSLGAKFVKAGQDLWDNFYAIFTPEQTDWSHLRIFYDEVFYPYMIGGIIPGIIAGTIAYYVSLPLITAFQNRRKGVIKAKLAELKKRKAEGRAP